MIASAHFSGRSIDIDQIPESLRGLLSKRRSRSVARPRQVAMALARELTNRSLPEIGEAFGGRDHTSVLHACRKIKELQETGHDMREHMKHLLRLLIN